jgi:NAD(P)-dependent dehydrogenase (short-subunit alcohol dehydrogenase family)
MGKTVFITDLDTPLGSELVRLYLKEGHRVFATVTEEEEEPDYGPLQNEAGESLTVQVWKRYSAASTKNMLLQALIAYESVQESLVLGAPPPYASPLQETELEMIERAVDSWIKGTLFLLKEILAHYEARGGGQLALISRDDETSASPLDGALRSGFLGMSRALLKTHGSETITINGFVSSAELTKDFAGFIARNLSERAKRPTGKWMRFQPGLLTNIKAGRIKSP